MNFIDLTLLHMLNAYARQWPAFDVLMEQMSDNVLLQGGIILVLFWWAWAMQREDKRKDREMLLFGLMASVFAVLFARALALTLPFRVRPLQNPALNFTLPYSMDPQTLIGWSSFPSDHAVVFLCLATSLWFVSRKLGAIAIAYALLGSSFPRVYLGIHYPSDVFAGAVIGISIACLAKWDVLREAVTRPLLRWSEQHPASFAAFLFFCTFELAEEFDSLRKLAVMGFHTAGAFFEAYR
jgi:undecaprenyl-diphosphatase